MWSLRPTNAKRRSDATGEQPERQTLNKVSQVLSGEHNLGVQGSTTRDWMAMFYLRPFAEARYRVQGGALHAKHTLALPVYASDRFKVRQAFPSLLSLTLHNLP